MVQKNCVTALNVQVFQTAKLIVDILRAGRKTPYVQQKQL
jgi:hypothetical protein